MKRKPSGYPVGAKWRAETNNMIGEFWLEQKMSETLEVWKWRVSYKTGTYAGGDWGATKSSVRDECAVSMRFNDRGAVVRFKRVEE